MNVWDLILATVDEFGTNASGDQMCNYASWKWRHMLTKFATNKVTPIMMSTHGFVVPLEMFIGETIAKSPKLQERLSLSMMQYDDNNMRPCGA